MEWWKRLSIGALLGAGAGMIANYFGTDAMTPGTGAIPPLDLSTVDPSLAPNMSLDPTIPAIPDTTPSDVPPGPMSLSTGPVAEPTSFVDKYLANKTTAITTSIGAVGGLLVGGRKEDGAEGDTAATWQDRERQRQYAAMQPPSVTG